MTSRENRLTRRTLLGAVILGPLAAQPIRAEGSNMKVRFEFAEQTFLATLEGNPSALDFASLLPLDLDMEDYSDNEKIAYLPRKLTEAGSAPFDNEAPGDLCYFAPWGNLALFYGPYRYSNGLIRLGRIEGGTNALLTRGSFPLRVEQSS